MGKRRECRSCAAHTFSNICRVCGSMALQTPGGDQGADYRLPTRTERRRLKLTATARSTAA